MGQGYALTEKFDIERGIFKSKTYKDLGVPTIMDAPEIEVIIVEEPEPQDPFGAKGISEMASIPVTPVILNVIYDVVGKRVYTIPNKP